MLSNASTDLEGHTRISSRSITSSRSAFAVIALAIHVFLGMSLSRIFGLMYRIRRRTDGCCDQEKHWSECLEDI